MTHKKRGYFLHCNQYITLILSDEMRINGLQKVG